MLITKKSHFLSNQGMALFGLIALAIVQKSYYYAIATDEHRLTQTFIVALSVHVCVVRGKN